jgi:hypothetical protein
VQPGYTTKNPDQHGLHEQLDPNSANNVGCTIYTLTLTTSVGSATSPVLSVGPTSYSPWSDGTEYWALTSTFIADWSTGTSLTFAATVYTGAPPSGWNGSVSSPTSHGSSMTSHWTQMVAGAPPASTLWSSGSFGVNVSSAGAVTWYYGGPTAPTQSYVLNSSNCSTTTFNKTNRPGSGTTWWQLNT